MLVMGNSSQHLAIAEANNFNWRHLEQDLVDWWMIQAEKSAHLLTTEGEHVIVVSAGQRNDGAGPDILNSHLIMGDLELIGSVEMHRKAVDWYHHKHEKNPSYNRVILHVVEDAGMGPDIPTLIIPKHKMSRQFCLAKRSVQQPELLRLAKLRFQHKAEHVRLLSQNAAKLSPLLLGMVEILQSGPRRSQNLQELAVKLGLSSWPHTRVWRGSNQSFPTKQRLTPVLDKLITNADLFNQVRWQSLPGANPGSSDSFLKPLLAFGVSRNQSREWLVNILAPYHADTGGFELWGEMATFRQYGIEKRGMANMGIKKLSNIAIQQALLEWQECYCSANSCSICPLVRSY